MIFSLCKTFHSLTYYCEWAVQNFTFFQFSPQTFFPDDLVLIKDQLILISYEKIGLKEEGPKWKRRQT
jgi:hypothetical protein